jgi:hypothetical protein
MFVCRKLPALSFSEVRELRRRLQTCAPLQETQRSVPGSTAQRAHHRDCLRLPDGLSV